MVLEELLYVLVYIDDVIIFAESIEGLMLVIGSVLEKLRLFKAE